MPKDYVQLQRQRCILWKTAPASSKMWVYGFSTHKMCSTVLWRLSVAVAVTRKGRDMVVICINIRSSMCHYQELLTPGSAPLHFTPTHA